jgi:hypothetical protein
MSNPIKYSTGTESLALKKGNFYIGTGDVGKGPTSATGYYNGISPPSGGYTIYLNKETGGPSIYTASNDAQLISLTNSIAGTSYTTVNECLVYFAGQTDKMVLNRNYEGIVTDGLVLNLDAGFTPSYPKSGTTWYDTKGTNNGTLTNGPTFSSSNGGILSFDGTDDDVDMGPTSDFFINGGSYSFEFFFNLNSFTGQQGPALLSGYRAGDRNRWDIFFDRQGNEKIGLLYHSGPYFATNSVISTNVWYHYVLTIKGSNGDVANYLNGVLDKSGNMGTVNRNLNTTVNLTIAGMTTNPGYNFNGDIPIFRLYDKVLSAEEITQNYNVQKGRFGL